jgi:hypothetical protein
MVCEKTSLPETLVAKLSVIIDLSKVICGCIKGLRQNKFQSMKDLFNTTWPQHGYKLHPSQGKHPTNTYILTLPASLTSNLYISEIWLHISFWALSCPYNKIDLCCIVWAPTAATIEFSQKRLMFGKLNWTHRDYSTVNKNLKKCTNEDFLSSEYPAFLGLIFWD